MTTIPNYPSNNKVAPIKPDAPEKKIEQVVVNEVTLRKKSMGRRFMDQFFDGQDSKTVWSNIIREVFLPAGRDVLSDAVNMFIYRDSRPNTRGGYRTGLGASPMGQFAYNQVTNTAKAAWQNAQQPRPMQTARVTPANDGGEIIMATRAEADAVISTMFDVISQYGSVSVADLYEMVGKSGNFTDNKYGWLDLQGARPAHDRRGGWTLSLPQPIPLD